MDIINIKKEDFKIINTLLSYDNVKYTSNMLCMEYWPSSFPGGDYLYVGAANLNKSTNKIKGQVNKKPLSILLVEGDSTAISFTLEDSGNEDYKKIHTLIADNPNYTDRYFKIYLTNTTAISSYYIICQVGKEYSPGGHILIELYNTIIANIDIKNNGYTYGLYLYKISNTIGNFDEYINIIFKLRTNNNYDIYRFIYDDEIPNDMIIFNIIDNSILITTNHIVLDNDCLCSTPDTLYVACGNTTKVFEESYEKSPVIFYKLYLYTDNLYPTIINGKDMYGKLGYDYGNNTFNIVMYTL